jgi:peptide/nickel transport system permease protein
VIVARYIVGRLLGMIPTALVLLLMVVLLMRLLPGSAVDIFLEGTGGDAQQKAEARRQMSHQLGLDRPLPEAYLSYVGAALHGDLGKSLWDKRPVAPQVLQRLLITGEIALVASVLAFIFGLPLGVLSAIRQDTWLDYLMRSVAILGISVPTFVIGTAVLILPAITLGWAPGQGFVSLRTDPVQNISLVIVPAAILALYLASSIMRLLRTTMLEVMRQDFIRTAAAKGLRERVVIVRHAVKNAMIPVVTLFSLQLAFLIGGSVIIESIFAIPGLGRLLLASLNGRDYPMIQGIVVVVGLLIMVVNLVTDISYAALDPRIRYG